MRSGEAERMSERRFCRRTLNFERAEDHVIDERAVRQFATRNSYIILGSWLSKYF